MYNSLLYIYFCRKTVVYLNILIISLSDHLTLDLVELTISVCPAFIIPQESDEDEKLPALNLLICLVARYIPLSPNSLYWPGHIPT